MTDEEFQVIYQGENNVYCYAKLKNGYATIKGSSWGDLELPEKSYFSLTTLPEKYRPAGLCHFCVVCLGNNASAFGNVGHDGVIQLYSTIKLGYWVYCFTYPVK